MCIIVFYGIFRASMVPTPRIAGQVETGKQRRDSLCPVIIFADNYPTLERAIKIINHTFPLIMRVSEPR